MTTYNFSAGLDGDIWVAICLEHDLVTQGDSLDDVKSSAVDMLRSCLVADREERRSMSERPPPPAHAVTEIDALPGACRFTVEVDHRVCECGATPDPSESSTTGNYVENGADKYICLRCWERANGSDRGAMPS